MTKIKMVLIALGSVLFIAGLVVLANYDGSTVDKNHDVPAASSTVSVDSVNQDQDLEPIIDENEALARVLMRTEVQDYEYEMEQLGAETAIGVEDLGNDWYVRVYEIVDDEYGPSHTATFGWYLVNKISGEVTRDL